jgi:flagellar hook-basal body complex protein FliE
MKSVNEKMGPKQWHQYMQYVFDTQFKTAEEKKMRKTIIKKINVGQKKKGLPIFKESVNEYDLGLTYKKGKTVKVKHKSSGKRLVIVDKPAVRKEYEKIGYFAESVNEAVEPKGNMAKIAKVVKDSQATKLSGVMIDMQSANLLMKLFNAVSDKDKEKMNKLNAKMLTTVIKKLWSRINLKLPI